MELPVDAPRTDRTDIALKARVQAMQEADDISWLERAGGIAKDVGTGAVEAPRMIAGGVRDAAQSILDLGTLAQEYMPLPGVQIFDKEGNFDLRFMSADAMQQDYAEGGAPNLPNIDDASSTTGGVVRGVSQFLAGFGLAGRAVGGVSTFGRAAAASAGSNFVAFDGQQARLSNLIETVPELQNPVTGFLAAKDDDPELVGRLKNVLEGAGLDGASALVTGRLLKQGLVAYKKHAAAAGESGSAAASTNIVKYLDAEQLTRDAADMTAIGDVNAPLLSKMDAAMAETATGVPDDVAAAALTPGKGLTKLGDTPVYVNFAKIETPDDIQAIIRDTTSAFSDTVDEARRGVRTNAQTALSADKIDAWQALAARRTGEPLNAETALAARQLWATAGDKLGEVAKLASSNPSPENLVQFRKMLATFHGIQKEVIAARSETARALQSWSIPAGGSKERMQALTQMLDRAGGSDVTADLARRIAIASEMPNGAQIVANLAEKGLWAKSVSSVQEYWINALLSNPKTHAVNIASNAGVIGVGMLERAAASRLSRFLGNDAGVQIGEVAAQVAGLRGGIVDAFRYAGKSLMTGETGYGLNKVEAGRLRNISSGAWNVRSSSWLGKAVDTLGAVVNVPGRLLAGEDEFFKTIGYRMELHAQAHRMAVRELPDAPASAVQARVAEILSDPPEAIRMASADTAAYQTFTNPGGNLVKATMRLKAQYPVINFILPFVQTPANILKYTFERTPLAPLTGRYRAAMAKGGADADLAMAKMGLGTMGLMFAVDLGMNGHTTGSGPGDKPSQQQNWRRQGNQPYSVRIGDKMIAFNRLDPLGYHLGIGADLAEYLMTAGATEAGPELDEAFAATVFSVAEGMTSKSYLQGLSLILEAVNEPDRFGPAYLERFAGSFVPAGVAEVARAMDPTWRQSHDLVTSLKRRIPGLTTDLPARRDLWGREATTGSGLGRAYDVMSPLYGSTVKPEPIDEAMQAGGWYVGMPSKTLQISGQSVSLKNRPDVYSDFLRLQGSTKPSELGEAGAKVLEKYGDASLLSTLNAIVKGRHPLSKAYEEDQEKVVDRAIADYRRAARAVILDKYPELTDLANRKKQAKQ